MIIRKVCDTDENEMGYEAGEHYHRVCDRTEGRIIRKVCDSDENEMGCKAG